MAESGEPDRGVGLLTDATATMNTIRSRHFMSYLMGLLTHAQMKAGHHADAIKAAEQGLALMEGGGERYYGAELHRLKGELLARPPYGQKREAQASFRAAITIAKAQGAAILQRRAEDSLRRWSEGS
jgi:adenylate cyclase